MTFTLVSLSPPPEGHLMPRMTTLRQWITEVCPNRVDSWFEFDQRQESFGMHGYDRSLRVKNMWFRFHRVEDAVLFKLTHGGQQ